MIIVLGSNGMLGRYASKYFSRNNEVKNITRKDFDFSNSDVQKLNQFLNSLSLKQDDVILNCIGVIKPQVKMAGDFATYFINSMLPHLLATWGELNGVVVIHPTTDCVFSGHDGKYNEYSMHDDHDIYGISKSLGESNRSTNLRVSIIGEEVGQSRSLIEWIKSNRNNTVNGFTNHLWNGITCLEWSKCIEKCINSGQLWKGVVHAYSPNAVTKAELVNIVNKIYDLGITVNPSEAATVCDRTLSTALSYGPKISRTLSEQIQEMKEFSEILYAPSL